MRGDYSRRSRENATISKFAFKFRCPANDQRKPVRYFRVGTYEMTLRKNRSIAITRSAESNWITFYYSSGLVIAVEMFADVVFWFLAIIFRLLLIW